MNAKEAREISYGAQTGYLNKYFSKIREASQQGQTGVTIWCDLNNKEKDKEQIEKITERLKELQYDVNFYYSDGANDYKLTIKW